MKNKFKSVFLTILAVFFIVMGIFNFNVQKDSFDIAYEDNEEKTGDVQLVNSDSVEIDNSEMNENSSVEEEDYFSASRIDRDKSFSQMIETYQNMIDSVGISSEQKSIAIEEVKKIENQKNGVLIAENLIKNKGFNDVVIFVNDKSVSVVIKSNVSLIKEQIVQIQNIVSRELSVEIENINISNR